MSEYDFILDALKYSYSSASSYNSCKHGFKLTYIDGAPRIGNFFSDYGNLIHKTNEMFFSGELEIWDLAEFYKNHYTEFIQNACPPYPANMAEGYFNSGLDFFDNFEFDKSKYEVIFIEEMVETTFHGINLIVKPDLILKEKSTGNHILVDYKTSKLKTGKLREKQMEDYKKQMYLYAYFLWTVKDIEIKEILIWFIRDNELVKIPVDSTKVQEVIDWFEETINKIKEETKWEPNNTKENSYFCNQICSVRLKCAYK